MAGLPKISDGQMIFMQNGLAKLKDTGMVHRSLVVMQGVAKAK